MKNVAYNNVVPLFPLDNERVKKDSVKKNKRSKAILVLFKTLSQNNYRLHESIDRKAKILVSVNAIIMSILLGTSMAQGVFTTLGSSHLMVLLSAVTLSTIFAIISIKPFILSPGELHMSDNKMINFTAIASMNISEYMDKVQEVTSSKNNIYDAMAQDIFFIGKNINRKFIYLRISGAIFLLGLITSAILMSTNII